MRIERQKSASYFLKNIYIRKDERHTKRKEENWTKTSLKIYKPKAIAGSGCATTSPMCQSGDSNP
jgi:hypothetical protein